MVIYIVPMNLQQLRYVFEVARNEAEAIGLKGNPGGSPLSRDG